MADRGFGITAYCFLPDHVHALLEGLRDDSALRPAIDRSKQACGYAHRREHRDRLWRTGYYERVLRSDVDALAAAAYIVANPIRAKLADSIFDYPYCGSGQFTLEQLAEAIRSGRSRREG